MAFKGLLGGGAAVETVLHRNRARPGEYVEGVVNVRGGHTAVVVNFIEMALTGRVKVISRHKIDHQIDHHKHFVTGAFQLEPNKTFQVPFALPIPWNMPFSVLVGTPFPGVRTGVRADLDLVLSTDKSDTEPLVVLALPSHDAILLGLTRLGFSIMGVRVERRDPRPFAPLGPIYQSVDFRVPSTFRDRMTRLEVTFTTDAQGMFVFLYIFRTGWSSTRKVNRFRVDHATALSQDWAAVMNQHLDAVMSGGKGRVDKDVAPVLRPAAPAPPAPAGAISLGSRPDVKLTKSSPGLARVTVGVGWGRSVSGASADLDVFAVVVDGAGCPLGSGYFVYFNNLCSPEGAVRHGGDTQDGERYGDDEIVQVDLTKCPPHAQRIVFIVATDSAGTLTFGQVRDAYIRIVDSASGQRIAKFDLDAQASQESAIIFGDLRRVGGGWTFAVVGQGNSQGLPGILRSFGLTV